MSIEKYLLSLRSKQHKGVLSQNITGVFADSQEVSPGSVFVALKGYKEDGHKYLNQAIAKGASALVVEDLKSLKGIYPFKGLLCVVKNTRDTLPLLLNKFYNSPSEKMFCIGVTGTNGKTTVTHILSFLLARLGWRVGLMGTIPPLGTLLSPSLSKGETKAQTKTQIKSQQAKPPFPMRNAKGLTTLSCVHLHSMLNYFYQAGAQAVVMEASSIGLDQKRTAGVDFNIGAFTNLSQDHLDYHSNMSNYFLAKKKLFQKNYLAQKNHFQAVLNLDDPYGLSLAKSLSTPYIFYGLKPARFAYQILASNLYGSEFNCFFEGKKIKAYLPMPGVYNVSNAMCALACVHLAGFCVTKALELLKHLPPVPGRLEKVQALDSKAKKLKTPLVFVDYAHTPSALKALLSFLQQNKAFKDGRLLTVFGCGGGRDKAKRPLMVQVAENLSDKVFFTSDNPREEKPMAIIDEGLKGALDKNKIIVEPLRKEAIKQALTQAGKKDIVLIAGKGHEREQIIGTKRQYFSDKEVVQDFFLKNF